MKSCQAQCETIWPQDNQVRNVLPSFLSLPSLQPWKGQNPSSKWGKAKSTLSLGAAFCLQQVLSRGAGRRLTFKRRWKFWSLQWTEYYHWKLRLAFVIWNNHPTLYHLEVARKKSWDCPSLHPESGRGTSTTEETKGGRMRNDWGKYLNTYCFSSILPFVIGCCGVAGGLSEDGYFWHCHLQRTEEKQTSRGASQVFQIKVGGDKCWQTKHRMTNNFIPIF